MLANTPMICCMKKKTQKQRKRNKKQNNNNKTGEHVAKSQSEYGNLWALILSALDSSGLALSSLVIVAKLNIARKWLWPWVPVIIHVTYPGSRVSDRCKWVVEVIVDWGLLEGRSYEHRYTPGQYSGRVSANCRSTLGVSTPEGGTLGISEWGCAAGTLDPLTYTRVSSAEFCYPLLQ